MGFFLLVFHISKDTEDYLCGVLRRKESGAKVSFLQGSEAIFMDYIKFSSMDIEARDV